MSSGGLLPCSSPPRSWLRVQLLRLLRDSAGAEGIFQPLPSLGQEASDDLVYLPLLWALFLCGLSICFTPLVFFFSFPFRLQLLE